MSVMFFVFLVSPAVVMMSSAITSSSFLDRGDNRKEEHIDDIGEEELVDDESDSEDDDAREVRDDKEGKMRALKFWIKSHLFKKKKGALGTHKYITPLDETEDGRSKEDKKSNRNKECLYETSGWWGWVGNRKIPIHWDEYSKDENKIDRWTDDNFCKSITNETEGFRSLVLWREESWEENKNTNPEHNPEKYRVDFFYTHNHKYDTKNETYKKHIHINRSNWKRCRDL